MRMSVEQPLCGREIVVPAKLPIILKQFCKAAIRTQPYDLLKWSSSYFRALADGEEPPTKLRLEYPPPSTASGLTLGFLRVLLRQFGNYNKTLPIETILHRWDCLCLDRKDFDTIVTVGGFHRVCQVKRFLAVAAGLLGANLTETMIMICQLFTHEPDGGSAMIPLTLFVEIYEYLAGLGTCDDSEKNALDQNTTEHTVCKDSSINRTCSITSQDTDADVNLDSELISKDEIDLSKIDLSMEVTASSSYEKEIISREERESKECTNKDSTIGEKFCGVKDVNSDESAFSEVEKDTACRPNVPGIGPCLPAEQIASVISWMLECAELQEGMVGPRNIRHTNCPSLHRRSSTS